MNLTLKKPERFDEVIGHDGVVRYLTARLKNRALPQFIIFVGEPGLGKTALATVLAMAHDCPSLNPPCGTCPTCKNNIEQLIKNNQDSQDIKRFNMNKENCIELSKDIVNQMNTNFITGESKVLMVDEINSMNDTAQEILFNPLENIPRNVHLIGTCLNKNDLTESIQSRAYFIRLNRLAPDDMTLLLKREAARRRLEIKNDAVYYMIGEHTEFKPRAALRVLEAMGTDISVTTDDIKDALAMISVDKIVPIIASFNGSPLIGIKACMWLPTDNGTRTDFLNTLLSAIRISKGVQVRNISPEDKKLLMSAVEGVSGDLLQEFMLQICRLPNFDNHGLLACYLTVHPSRYEISKQNKTNILYEEMEAKKKQDISVDSKNIEKEGKIKAPTIEDLKMQGKIIRG